MSIEYLYSKFYEIGSKDDSSEINYKELFTASNNLIVQVSFSKVAELRAFIYAKNDEEIYYMPFWLKMIIFRNLINENPNDKETLEWFINQLEWFASDKIDYINELKDQLSKIV